MKYPITEDISEIRALGRQIAADNPGRYPERLWHDFRHKFWEYQPDEEQLRGVYHCAVYHQQVYGTSIMDYLTYRFRERTHAEKAEYVTWYGRFVYMAFLNKNRDLHLLDNKYEAYRLLAPFYKREAMAVGSWDDYEAFCAFVARHSRVFVKPINLELAEGVHRMVVRPADDLRALFGSLLEEAAALGCEDVTREVDHRLILEEELVQSAEMARFNPSEMSVVRVTTVLLKDRVHYFYPCFRMMCGDGEAQKGEMYSYDALIDADTGELVTDGIESRGEVERHPVTGMKIKGYRMPEWEQLKAMLEAAARRLPTLRYIGWDVAHTRKGWSIIEGNTNGEFFFQMCVGHGVKREFEDLIGFHVPLGFMLEEVEQLVDNRKKKKYEREN